APMAAFAAALFTAYPNPIEIVVAVTPGTPGAKVTGADGAANAPDPTDTPAPEPTSVEGLPTPEPPDPPLDPLAAAPGGSVLVPDGCSVVEPWARFSCPPPVVLPSPAWWCTVVRHAASAISAPATRPRARPSRGRVMRRTRRSQDSCRLGHGLGGETTAEVHTGHRPVGAAGEVAA